MSSRKIVCAVSLGSFLALIVGVAVASEVRAGALDPTDVPLAAVTPEIVEQAQAFDGEWSYVGGQKERDGIDAAIETSVEALSPMLRKLGRKRLHETNSAAKTVSIDIEGESASIHFDGDGHTAKLDGTPIKSNNQGDKVKISHRMHGSKLDQFIDGVGGDRRNTFKLSQDGQRLTLKVEITSGHLPVPVEYRLTYKRK